MTTAARPSSSHRPSRHAPTMGLGGEKHQLLTTFERDDVAEIQRKIDGKHGMMTGMTKLLGTLGGIVKRNRTPYGDQGVNVAIEE